MLSEKENPKAEGSGDGKKEEKQSGEEAKMEEVPIAEPVNETTGTPETAVAETSDAEKKEGEKEVKAEVKGETQKPQQPEQEPGDASAKPKPTPSPVQAPTGEGDLEKGPAPEGEKKTEKKGQPEPTFSELGGNLLAIMHKNGGWSIVLCFASFILLIQASVLLSQPQLRLAFFVLGRTTPGVSAEITKYAVAYAAITMCASLTFALVMKFKGVPEKPRQLFIVLLFIWVVIGTGILTFRGPFVALSNGYFAAWVMLVGCYLMFKQEVKEAAQYVENFTTNAGYLTLLFVFSLMEFFSALAICTTGQVCGGITIYAIVVGLISAVVCMIVGIVSALGSLERKICFSSLLVWWIVAMFALTFPMEGPFLFAGNGFFSLWISLLLVGALTFLEFRENPGLTA